MTKEEIFSVFLGKETWEVYDQFKKIENEIEGSDELYSYFDDIQKLLSNDKSHIQMRAFRIVCKLAKWDKENHIQNNIDLLLSVLDDDKPTIVRQCLTALHTLLLYKPELSNIVEEKLKHLDCSKYKDSMRPLIQKDIQDILEHL